MIDKIQMAHEHAQGLLSKKKTEFYVLKDVVAEAWRYADAMQAEADKRKPSGVPEAIRSLTKDNVGNCMHFHHEFGHKNCMDCGASLEQWQPDWSQAPAGFNWWFATAGKDGVCNGGFFSTVKSEPSPMTYKPKESCWITRDGELVETPSFNYQGDWKDSLRKRPEIKESCQ